MATEFFDHETLEKERLAAEQERITRHVVAPGARSEFEKQEDPSLSARAQAVEDAKMRAVMEKKANLPRFDPANKDAAGAFKILDAFETQTLVTLRNNEFTEAYNAGRWNDLFHFFTLTGGVVGVGGKEFTGKADIIGYFERLRNGGGHNLKHTPVSYVCESDREIKEWGSKYATSNASGTYSITWRRVGAAWLIAKLTYHS